ncbi:MAG: cytidine deaminase [Clostridiales bacterium]|jgi:cytidine deaminase|nr:cytidine deaminase [Clostridiales bacterium]
MTNEELYEIACRVRENAYSPYSHVKVGAALLTGSGAVYTGVNVENASYGAAICAERSAAVQAVGNGDREFIKIAVAVSGSRVKSPCGICRQFLAEFSRNLTVVYEKNGALTAQKLSELLPDSFAL